MRQNFVPEIPDALMKAATSKISLEKQKGDIKEDLKALFPTLLGKDMPTIEVKVDEEKGVSLQ